MSDTHQKKQEEPKNIVNPVLAGIAGAVAGGVAVASAIALSDKKTQKQVKQVLTNAKDKAIGYMENMQNQAQDKMGEVKKQVKKAANSL